MGKCIWNCEEEAVYDGMCEWHLDNPELDAVHQLREAGCVEAEMVRVWCDCGDALEELVDGGLWCETCQITTYEGGYEQ